jgi:hypothetical protein
MIKVGLLLPTSFSRIIASAMLVTLSCSLATSATARDPDREPRIDRSNENRADQIADKAAQNASRAEERAARDTAKFNEERIRLETRQAQDIAKDPERAAEVNARAAEDIATLQIDQAEDAAKDQADTADDIADAAEDVAKDAGEDERDGSSGSGSDDNRNSGSSDGMRDIAVSENPEFDNNGYPTRRGEIVALDLSPATLKRAESVGFRVISAKTLSSIGASVTRLAVPSGQSAANGLRTMQRIDPNASFDLSHYYGLNTGVAGTVDRSVPRARPAKPRAFTVGMIDTAVMPNALLNSAKLEARDLGVGNGIAPLTHGTAVASILVNEGAAKIVSANVFRGSGEKIFTSADAITTALEWMVEKKVSIINISLVGPRNLVLDRLIRRVIANGHTIVAAAGNGGPSAPPAYPAAVPEVIAVTAVDSNGRIYRYANRGDYISVAAIGVGVLAATPSGGTASVSGTSFATPHIAAHLAQCIGNAAQKNRTQCIRAMEKEAKDLGPPGRDAIYGFGVIE